MSLLPSMVLQNTILYFISFHLYCIHIGVFIASCDISRMNINLRIMSFLELPRIWYPKPECQLLLRINERLLKGAKSYKDQSLLFKLN